MLGNDDIDGYVKVQPCLTYYNKRHKSGMIITASHTYFVCINDNKSTQNTVLMYNAGYKAHVYAESIDMTAKYPHATFQFNAPSTCSFCGIIRKKSLKNACSQNPTPSPNPGNQWNQYITPEGGDIKTGEIFSSIKLFVEFSGWTW